MSFLFDPDVIDEIGQRHLGKAHFPDHCWMLEYARGELFGLLPFGMANTFFNTLDFKSAFRTLKIYGTLTLRHLRAERARRR